MTQRQWIMAVGVGVLGCLPACSHTADHKTAAEASADKAVAASRPAATAPPSELITPRSPYAAVAYPRAQEKERERLDIDPAGVVDHVPAGTPIGKTPGA